MTEQTIDAPTEESVAKTVAEYETLAIGTGARAEFDAPEFTADGTTWTHVWLSDAAPVAARATARRDGAASNVVVLWRDAVPEDDAWRELWENRPMPLFGAYVRRDAIRHAFRDVIGERREPGDRQVAPPAAPERDFDAEIANAETVEDLDAVWSAARAARQRTGSREKTYKLRRAELPRREEGVADVASAWEPPAESAPVKAEQPVPHPPTVKLESALNRSPRPERRVKRQSPQMAAALSEAVEKASEEGRPVDRVVRRAARSEGRSA